MDKFMDLPCQFRAAQLDTQSYNESANTVEVIWSTGARVRREASGGRFDEELAMDLGSVRLGRLNSGAPLLNTHSEVTLSDVIGSVVPGSARMIDGAGIATVRLSRAPGDADIVTKIRDGIIRNISVGYLRHKIDKQKATREMEVPVWRVTDWEPIELSAVPVPADPGAHIRSERAETSRCLMSDSEPPPEIFRTRMRMRAR